MLSHANGDRDMHHFINTDSASTWAANPMHFKLRTKSPLTFLPALLQTLHQQLTTTPHAQGCTGIAGGLSREGRQGDRSGTQYQVAELFTSRLRVQIRTSSAGTKKVIICCRPEWMVPCRAGSHASFLSITGLDLITDMDRCQQRAPCVVTPRALQPFQPSALGCSPGPSALEAKSTQCLLQARLSQPSTASAAATSLRGSEDTA